MVKYLCDTSWVTRRREAGVGRSAFSAMADVIDVNRLGIGWIRDIIREQSSCVLVRSAYYSIIIWKCETARHLREKKRKKRKSNRYGVKMEMALNNKLSYSSSSSFIYSLTPLLRSQGPCWRCEYSTKMYRALARRGSVFQRQLFSACSQEKSQAPGGCS